MTNIDICLVDTLTINNDRRHRVIIIVANRTSIIDDRAPRCCGHIYHIIIPFENHSRHRDAIL